MTEQVETTSLAIEDVANPNPVSFNPEPKEVKEAVKPPSAREAIEKSLGDIEKADGKRLPEDPRDAKADKVDVAKADDKAPKVEDKPAKERQPDGKFAAKAPEVAAADDAAPDAPLDAPKPPAGERDINRAPDNFLPRAKERWAEAPEEVRGEFYRALDNFEKGKAEYHEDREFRKSLRSYEELAASAQTTIPAYLENTLRINQLLNTDLVAGLEAITQQYGVTLPQVAQYVLQQAQQDQQQPERVQTRQLEQQVKQLSQQLQGVTQQTQQQQADQVLQNIEQTIVAPFKAEHPRYDELADDIALFLNSGKIPSTLSAQQRLAHAYDMAERINPAPNSPSAQRPINPAGEKSIRGAQNGLDHRPARGAKLNARDAIAAAMDNMGL